MENIKVREVKRNYIKVREVKRDFILDRENFNLISDKILNCYCEGVKRYVAEDNNSNIVDPELEAKCLYSNIITDYSFDSYLGDKSRGSLEYLKTIAENPDKFINKKMIYMYGTNGTQKTSMAQVLGKELIIKGYTVQYTLMSDLITFLIPNYQDSLRTRGKHEFFVNKCMDCDFLIIDEAFDLSKVFIYPSGYQIPFLEEFMRKRFAMGKTFIFISNKRPCDIGKVPPPKYGKEQKGFGKWLQYWVGDNVKESLLEFTDKWVENVDYINPRDFLFRDVKEHGALDYIREVMRGETT